MRWWPFGRRAKGRRDNGRRPGSASSGGETVPHLRDLLPRIKLEFERARRYERSVTVAVFALADGTAVDSGSCSLASVLPAVVREAIRETDLVACDEESRRCILVMPEIGYEEGRRAVDRMRRLCAERVSCEVQADIAVFPQDGWVFTDLVEVAQRQAHAAPGRGVVVPASHPAV